MTPPRDCRAGLGHALRLSRLAPPRQRPRRWCRASPLDRPVQLAVAGIHLSDVPSLEYDRHLFRERELVSVTSNTRQDGEELLALASRLPIAVHATIIVHVRRRMWRLSHASNVALA